MKLIHLLMAAVALTVSAGAPQTAEDNAADAARLVTALALVPGAVIAEIGAGSGELTIILAKTVGDAGKVYSNEISADRKREIADAVAAERLSNVTIVDGAAADANLPADCCDALFMRNVYHHFADPAAMDATLFRALKTGGRIAVIDFEPDGAESTEPAGRAEESHHGVTAQSVARELKAAGFLDTRIERLARKGFMVVAHKPIAP